MAFTRGRRSRSISGFALAGGWAAGLAMIEGCGSDVPNLFPDAEAGHGGSMAAAGQSIRGGDGGAESGGRAIIGGAGTTSGGRGSTGGRAGTSGSAGTGGGRAGEGGMGGDEGDSGGRGSLACDDDDVCTTDTRLASGCQHVSAPDGLSCDDGKSCTSSDVCRSGTCRGTLSSLELEKAVTQDIPDGQESCHGVQGELAVSFEATSSAEVGEIVVDIELEHPYVSEVRVALRHDPSGRSARVVWNPEAPNSKVEGTYSFADGAAEFPVVQADDIPRGTYAPTDAFAATFEGIPMAGTWTLLFSDMCAGDVGIVRSATLHISAAPCP